MAEGGDPEVLLRNMQAQIVQLSAELATMKRGPAQLPKGVKVPVPDPFKGSADGDSVQNFLEAMETYFKLVNMEDSTQRARYTSTLLTEKARTWYSTQGYREDSLQWHHLKSDLLKAFRPPDYARVARKKLVATKQTTPDTSEYIARFNQALNRCTDVG